MKKQDFKLEELLQSIDMMCLSAEELDIDSLTTKESRYSQEELEEMGFREAQMEEIQLGIKQLLPIQHYARTCYNWKQMQEIRIGLLRGLDIRMYDNDLFSAEQMKEIRLGLEHQLDVSAYANLILTATDMARIRKQMLSDAYFHNPSGYAKEIIDESGILIRISDDCMQAFLTLPENKSFRVAQLLRILEKNEIHSGILQEQLQKAAEGNLANEELLIATGTPATTGRDGTYEYFFELSEDTPTMKEDGTVDYAHIVVADKKNVGDVLAKYYPAEKGTDGVTVTGIMIRGISGIELPVLHGQGIKRDEEQHLYRAATRGYAMLDEEQGTLNVWDVYVVDGDVNRYNGNISYDGIIHILGSVSDMAEIEASGNIMIDGYVESAKIRAGGNIILRSGMNGDGKGLLEADGKVSGKFFEGTTIHAKGDVEGSYFLNCNVVTDKSLLAREAHSKIIGGTIQAGYSVEVDTVINSGRTVTMIEVGDLLWIEKRCREAEQKLAHTEEEWTQLTEGKEKIDDMAGEETQQQKELLHKICLAIEIKEKEVQKLKKEVQYYEQMEKRAKRAFIQVRSRIQSGVVMSVCGKVKKIEKEVCELVTFKTERV